MAIQVMVPKEGSTESCLIVKWNYKVGDAVKAGDPICEVETEKSAFDVEAPETGFLLDIFFNEGKEVPVLTTIAVIGKHGENYQDLIPAHSGEMLALSSSAVQDTVFINQKEEEKEKEIVKSESLEKSNDKNERVEKNNDKLKSVEKNNSKNEKILFSPRARKLAKDEGILLSKGRGLTGTTGIIDVTGVTSATGITGISGLTGTTSATGLSGLTDLKGTGPDGSIIERDVKMWLLQNQPPEEERFEVQHIDNINIQKASLEANNKDMPDGEYTEALLNGVRKVVAEKMLSSLQTSAQFTLHTTANAEILLECRKKLKNSPVGMGLTGITINDMILFAVSRVLCNFIEINGTFAENKIKIYRNINLGFAVDAPKGLFVPVIKCANKLSLKEISDTVVKLTNSCREGKVAIDDLADGTFTVSNLGSLGIDGFTPILNIPQSGILGVGRINLKPVYKDDVVLFENHMELSLTVNHQIINGAPAARFLRALADFLADFDLMMVP